MFKCCAPKPTVMYKHDDKTYKIPKKAADTIGRFARGKIARIEVNKLKKDKVEEITSKWPALVIKIWMIRTYVYNLYLLSCF